MKSSVDISTSKYGTREYWIIWFFYLSDGCHNLLHDGRICQHLRRFLLSVYSIQLIDTYIDIVKYIPHPDTLRISLVIVDGELHLDHGLIVRHGDGDLRDGAGGGGCPGCQQHEAQGSQWSWQHDYSTAAQFDDLWSRVSGIRDVILI